jgi:hypothetical protein
VSRQNSVSAELIAVLVAVTGGVATTNKRQNDSDIVVEAAAPFSIIMINPVQLAIKTALTLGKPH